MFFVAKGNFCSVQTDSKRQITKMFPSNLKAVSLEDVSLPFELKLTAACYKAQDHCIAQFG